MSTRQDIARWLDECLQWADEQDEELPKGFNVRAFQNMRRVLKDGGSLTEKQVDWVAGIHERVLGVPHYRNEFSAGLVPTGNPVPTPAVLLNLPKKPPSRRPGP